MVIFLNLFGTSLLRIPGGIAYGLSWQFWLPFGLFDPRTLTSCLSHAHVVRGTEIVVDPLTVLSKGETTYRFVTPDFWLGIWHI